MNKLRQSDISLIKPYRCDLSQLIINHPEHIDQSTLIEIIRDMGVEFVSTLQQSNQNYSTTVTKNGYVIDEQADWGVGFYLLHGIVDAFYSYNDFTRSTSTIVDLANKIMKNGELSEDEENKISFPSSSVFDIREESPWTSDIFTDIEELAKLLTYQMQDYHSIQYEFQIEAKSIDKTIQNSLGAHISQKFDTAQIDISLQSSMNQFPVHLQETIGGIQNADFQIDAVVDFLQEKLLQLSDMTELGKLDPGYYDVILSPDTAYSIIHESIGHGCEADQVVNGTSFLTNKIGHKVASSNLTITDDPHLRGNGWSEYDDEGTKTKGTLLVEDGILVDYLHSSKTAKISGSPRTGNARVNSYLHKPEPRQSNLFVEPKDFTLEEMLESSDRAIYLGPSFVASTSIYTGEIHIETQYGRLIEDGEMTDYLAPITLTGNALELLNKIEGVGDQISKFPTQCLKSTSKIDIGAYAPHIKMGKVFLQ